MQALLDHITPNIRSVIINFKEQSIDLSFVFDSKPEIDDEDYENAEDVRKKMQRDFPLETVILHCIHISSTEYPVKKGDAVFIRKI